MILNDLHIQKKLANISTQKKGLNVWYGWYIN
jgi:hypothetical protein